MPKYKNITDKIIHAGFNEIRPNGILESEVYYEIVGLNKISDDPRWRCTKYSEVFSGNLGDSSGDIIVPAGLKIYAISIEVALGGVIAVFNDLAIINYKIIAGFSKTFGFRSRLVDKFEIVAGVNGTSYTVSIESFN